jgi:hypothetical protein
MIGRLLFLAFGSAICGSRLVDGKKVYEKGFNRGYADGTKETKEAFIKRDKNRCVIMRTPIKDMNDIEKYKKKLIGYDYTKYNPDRADIEIKFLKEQLDTKNHWSNFHLENYRMGICRICDEKTCEICEKEENDRKKLPFQI